MRNLFAYLLVLFSFVTFAQTDDSPLEISTSISKVSDVEYDLIFNIVIAEDWHLYSQYNPPTASLPMSITPAEGEEGYMLMGKAKESETDTEFSEIWGMDEIFFVDEAILIQRIKITDPTVKKVVLNLDAQICKEFCLPFDEDFVFKFSLEEGTTEIEKVEVDDKSKRLTKELYLNLKNTDLLKSKSTIAIAKKDNKSNFSKLVSIFLLGFVGGLFAFLTPCVFPMVPLTVSFFTKKSDNKKKGTSNAFLYGFFIVLIYILLSLPFHFLDSVDPEILNSISTNVWLNLFFFLVLIFFAGSFFGFYEITLPSSWSNKMDSASGIGGLIGIFFMALTLAIVSFSCTGPILGSLLASSLTSDAGAMQLTSGMTGFGLALALPFALFALFPGWLNSLPKSGGWLNTIKAILGFIELAFAFKFLSNADLVGHWGILPREVFLVIWMIIFLVFALYLFGKIRFPGGRAIKKLAGIRILFGLACLAIVVYLAGGIFKKPLWNLNLLSGFAPPAFHSIYKQDSNCPLGLNCFKDFNEGIAYAKEVNKPVLLDFTGWACVNCRKMEENVWSQNDVYNTLKNEFVLISLYVDDNEKMLPKDQQFEFLKRNGKIKRIRSYGDKWATFQVVNFQNASQPYYVMLSPDLEILDVPQQYTERETYYNWLQGGLSKFKK